MDTPPGPRRRRSLPWSLFASFREPRTRAENRNDPGSSNELPIQTQANTQTPSGPSQTLPLARAQVPTPPRTPPERALPRPPFRRNTAPNGRRIRPTRLDPIPEESTPDEHVETLAKDKNTRKRKQRQDQDGTGRRPVPIYVVPDASRVGARPNDRRTHAFGPAAPPPPPLFDRNPIQPLLGREHPGAAFRRNTPFMLERPDRFVVNPLTPRRTPHVSYFTEIVDRPGGPPVPTFRLSGVPIPDGRRPNPFLPPEMPNRRTEPAPPSSPRSRLRHAGRSIGSLRSVAQAQNEPRPTRQGPFAGFNERVGLIESRSGKEMPARYRGGTPKGG
ncbi:hypothetical protein DTO271G3_1104 [Paecilomyces variotii]|nr:hypothetical protein DTO271G3_1104 [Paecilomyces variotii]